MNERIEQLKQQAEAYVDSVDDGLGIEHYRQSVDLKFAELIVRECIDSIKNNVWGVTMCGTDTKGLCIRAIKEQFGVEE